MPIVKLIETLASKNNFEGTLAMVKQKAKLIETWRNDDLAPGGNKRIWIVSHNGQSQVYYTKRDARAAKAEIDKEQ